MSGGYSGKLSQRQCKIQLSRDDLGDQKVLESALFRLSKSLKSIIITTMVAFPGGIYWVYYKPPVSSYSEVGSYAPLLSLFDFFALFCYSQPANT